MDQKTNDARAVTRTLHGLETADGAGVRLTRLIGGPQLAQLDPFLLLDAFGSDDPDEYLAGFPSHPHRGFETVTYLLAGSVAHHDNAGHAGVITAGGVQWMTAGRGIVHSEMPRQEDGLLAGFQLWVNLPAARKMSAPRYQEHPVEQIPVEEREGGVRVKVVGGTSSRGTEGPVRQLLTPARFLDLSLPAGSATDEALPAHWNAFVYVIAGTLRVGGEAVGAGALAVLGPGRRVHIEAPESGRALLVAGEPLHEPVARRGPFVMNTEAELHQAFRDYQEGRL